MASTDSRNKPKPVENSIPKRGMNKDDFEEGEITSDNEDMSLDEHKETQRSKEKHNHKDLKKPKFSERDSFSYSSSSSYRSKSPRRRKDGNSRSYARDTSSESTEETTSFRRSCSSRKRIKTPRRRHRFSSSSRSFSPRRRESSKRRRRSRSHKRDISDSSRSRSPQKKRSRGRRYSKRRRYYHESSDSSSISISPKRRHHKSHRSTSSSYSPKRKESNRKFSDKVSSSAAERRSSTDCNVKKTIRCSTIKNKSRKCSPILEPDQKKTKDEPKNRDNKRRQSDTSPRPSVRNQIPSFDELSRALNADDKAELIKRWQNEKRAEKRLEKKNAVLVASDVQDSAKQPLKGEKKSKSNAHKVPMGKEKLPNATSIIPKNAPTVSERQQEKKKERQKILSEQRNSGEATKKATRPAEKPKRVNSIQKPIIQKETTQDAHTETQLSQSISNEAGAKAQYDMSLEKNNYRIPRKGKIQKKLDSVITESQTKLENGDIKKESSGASTWKTIINQSSPPSSIKQNQQKNPATLQSPEFPVTKSAVNEKLRNGAFISSQTQKKVETEERSLTTGKIGETMGKETMKFNRSKKGEEGPASQKLERQSKQTVCDKFCRAELLGIFGSFSPSPVQSPSDENPTQDEIPSGSQLADDPIIDNLNKNNQRELDNCESWNKRPIVLSDQQYRMLIDALATIKNTKNGGMQPNEAANSSEDFGTRDQLFRSENPRKSRIPEHPSCHSSLENGLEVTKQNQVVKQKDVSPYDPETSLQGIHKRGAEDVPEYIPTPIKKDVVEIRAFKVLNTKFMPWVDAASRFFQKLSEVNCLGRHKSQLLQMQTKLVKREYLTRSEFELDVNEYIDVLKAFHDNTQTDYWRAEFLKLFIRAEYDSRVERFVLYSEQEMAKTMSSLWACQKKIRELDEPHAQ